MASEKKKSNSTLKKWMQGQSFLTLNFFKSNWYYVLAITIMLLMFISNKYVCQENLAEVIRLSDELDDAKTDCVKASAEYNSKIRESEMTTLIEENGINLQTPDQPPFKLTEK